MVATRFKGKTLFVDTAPLIYFTEGHSEYQQILYELFEANDEDELFFITSTITLLEVLVQPMRLGKEDVAARYRHLLTESKSIEVIELTNAIATKAALLRARHNLKTPDSIQIATAIEHRADYFLTNDHRLTRIDDIKIITLTDLQT